MSAIDSMRRCLIDAALGDFWVAFFSLLEKRGGADVGSYKK